VVAQEGREDDGYSHDHRDLPEVFSLAQARQVQRPDDVQSHQDQPEDRNYFCQTFRPLSNLRHTIGAFDANGVLRRAGWTVFDWAVFDWTGRAGRIEFVARIGALGKSITPHGFLRQAFAAASARRSGRNLESCLA